MKKILFALAPIAIAAGLAFSYGDSLPIGSDLPKADVKMKDVSGKDISIKDAKKENGVLVMFSCNTCPYVIKNQVRTKNVAQLATKYKLGVIILNSNEAQRTSDDSFDAMKAYAKEQGYAWNYVVDKNSELADAFGANRTPECYLFDKNLKLVYHGAIDDNPSDENAVSAQYLRTAIKAVAHNEEIAVKESKSVGCTIKRVK
ncbi:thioredoxin family protein [Ferruginibacter sp. HRS2-29]|uniref:thioredoxin family protein n=1 Tax=Ferruginibacter sp. HRS2-29 TaxID=2487334 RepID=UPI0020CCA612|nr:thioredoxin family protein [Ferruginibacter sp. HRS2-29]MCP9751188.1 thioredoxin family protein [Ferruginibacter sp. HRS2-29]